MIKIQARLLVEKIAFILFLTLAIQLLFTVSTTQQAKLQSDSTSVESQNEANMGLKRSDV